MTIWQGRFQMTVIIFFSLFKLLFSCYYFPVVILYLLNTEFFSSFNKWLSNMIPAAELWNAFYILPDVDHQAERIWFIIFYPFSLLFLFFSGELINSIYSLHLFCCLSQLILTGGLKRQCKFMPNSYSVLNVQDEVSLFFCALWRK